MTLLAILVTHLAPEAVMVSIDNIRAGLPPDSRIVVSHGGRREDFERLEFGAKRFADDPGLRGAPATLQSYNGILADVFRTYVREDHRIEHVLLVEYDQVVLRSDFGQGLLTVLDGLDADFVGKNCVDRSATNWWHRVRYQHDPEFMSFLRDVSVRDDPRRIFGCLGSGFVMRRRALTAFCEIQHPAGIYNELYLPTLIHHLGFRVSDVDAVSDLYGAVRWTPPYTLGEVQRLRSSGVSVVHPFKEIGEVARLTPSPA